jgi:multisubunit Na+/H+ antiporter MnhE subunit
MVAAVLYAIWLLLVDTREEPQLLAGLAVAAIGATGSELVRRQRVADVSFRLAWLARAWRPLTSVPADLLRLARGALAALAGGSRTAGRFRAIPFDPGDGSPRDVGREALAEIAGSFSPNTYVIGIDEERRELLVHQLAPEEDEPQRSIDPLDLR